MELQIVLLRTLVTIVDLGSFSRAAEALHITQPAVSQHVRRLDTFLKQPVFVSTGRNLRLSVAGEKLLGYAGKMVALHDEAVARLAPSTDMPRLTVGVSDQFTDVLPEVLRGWKRRAADVQVVVRTGADGQLARELSAGGLDIALLLDQDDVTINGGVRRLGQVEMAWFGRPAIGRDAALPLVVFAEPSSLRDRVIGAVETCGSRWRIAYEGTELTGVRAAIQAGLGVGCLIANAGELWQTPTAIAPRLPAPPRAVPLNLAFTERLSTELTGAAVKVFHHALRDYPIETDTGHAAVSTAAVNVKPMPVPISTT